jgi:hypothetical protein
MFFGEYSMFYIITIVLQAICVIHSIRKGTQQKWIWIIVFLPLVGALAYIFTEMFSKGDLQQVQSGVVHAINPGGIIKKLEERLRFADTFQNRILLADAYLQGGFTDKAIELYENSLVGNFSENEHVLMQLCLAYTSKGQYEKTIEAAKKVSKVPQFLRSSSHVAYAIALGKAGMPDASETEFRKMSGKFANYEARYHFGVMLKEHNRPDEARQIWQQMVDEKQHISGTEKKFHKQWIQAAQDALRS